MAVSVDSILTKSGSTLASDHASVVSINLFVALLCACIVIGHLLEENRWMNESITALAIVSDYIHSTLYCVLVLFVFFGIYICIIYDRFTAS